VRERKRVEPAAVEGGVEPEIPAETTADVQAEAPAVMPIGKRRRGTAVRTIKIQITVTEPYSEKLATAAAVMRMTKGEVIESLTRDAFNGFRCAVITPAMQSLLRRQQRNAG
jgi:hypothetical protein